MRDIGCHYVTSERNFQYRKTMEKLPLILPAKVPRAFTESARQTVSVIHENIVLTALKTLITMRYASSFHILQFYNINRIQYH